MKHQEAMEFFETVKVVYLNKNNNVKEIGTITTGGFMGTVIDLRLIFAIVLKTLSTSIILTNNHPSGALQTSCADIQMTEKIIRAGELLDITVLDHLIVTPNMDY